MTCFTRPAFSPTYSVSTPDRRASATGSCTAPIWFSLAEMPSRDCTAHGDGGGSVPVVSLEPSTCGATTGAKLGAVPVVVSPAAPRLPQPAAAKTDAHASASTRRPG